ncbi:MAG: type II toxin-antitoxin system VapC family toxin [Chloroflexota bacterium]
MILYADTSALVKKYVRESGSNRVLAFFESFEIIATAALTQVEMAAAMAKAIRQGWLDESTMLPAWQDFLAHWPAYTRLPISTGMVDRASGLAWQHGLRVYDAIHLACALTWQNATGEETSFACFDKHLHQAARKEGLLAWPEMET